MNTRPERMRGITLLEGLVAVAVLAFGLLALFKFQADALRSGTDAKSRTEALQIAEAHLGVVRDASAAYAQFLVSPERLAASSDKNAFPSYLGAEATRLDNLDRPGVRQRLGTDADITTTVSNSYPPTVSVVVGWTGAGGVQQQVQTASVVTLKDPVAGMILAEKDSEGGTVRSPSGDARYGTGKNYMTDYTPGDGIRDKGDPGVIIKDNQDGVKLVYNATDALYQLVDTGTYDVRIESATGLAEISGTVYVKAGMNMNLDYIKVGAPDVSWCMTPASQRYQVSGPSGLIYNALPYYCYVGTGWYGAIGPLADDPAQSSTDPLQPERSEFGTNDHVCVGEDGILDNGESDSRHPQLSFKRLYRGYLRDPAGAVDAQGDPVYQTAGIDHPKDPSTNTIASFFAEYEHDFVIDTFNGNPTDSDCNSRLAAGEVATGTDPSGNLWPVTFDGNPGKLYCITESCPDPLPVDGTEAVDSTEATISGHFVLAGTESDNPPTYVLGGTVVTSDTGQACSSANDGSYVCTVYVVGDGGTWTGSIVGSPPTGKYITNAIQRTVNVTPAQPVTEDFVVAAITMQPRTLSGNVDLSGASYTGITTDHGGACAWQVGTGGKGASGRFSCDYPSLPGGSTVTLTVATGKVVCASSGSPSVPSSVSGTNVTMTGIGGDLDNITLVVRSKASSCP